MHYLVLLGGDESLDPAPGTPEFDAMMAGYERFGELAGPTIRGGEALQPKATAATIRHGDGAPLVTDGPYAETTEAIGGSTSSRSTRWTTPSSWPRRSLRPRRAGSRCGRWSCGRPRRAPRSPASATWPH